MRRIVTWSARGKHPWIVIAIWIVIAGALSMGPKLPERDHQRRLQVPLRRASRASAPTRCSSVVPQRQGHARHRRLQLRRAAHGRRQGGRSPTGEAWLTSGDEPINSASVQYSPDGKGALIFASLDGNPGDEALPRLGPGDPRPLRRHRRRDAGPGHRPRRPDHRRLQDLPERRRQAARRHGPPRARAAAAHLPLAGPALRAADHRRLRLLRRRRHPGPASPRPPGRPSPARPPPSWSSCCSAPAPTTGCCSSPATARTCAARATRASPWPRRWARPGRRSPPAA